MMNCTYDIYKKSITVMLLCFITIQVFSQQLSDNDIKKNIEPVAAPLQKLLQLHPKMYEFETNKYKHLKLQQGRRYGFLAANVQAVFPELVNEKTFSYMFAKNGYRDTSFKTVDELSLIPLLVASIKEQQLQIEQLKAAIEELKNKKGVAVN
ncbi:MAG: tail fiber domain-containing protein [Chitinophagaceae bacterium]|nr:tail fiber domain-containing protein [Chitinophagaceae bacterium]